MTNPTETAAAAIRDHYPVFDERGHINGTVPGRGSWHCWCDRVVDTTEDEVVSHVAAVVVAALAGGVTP